MLERNTRFNILNAVAAAVAMNMIQPYVGILAVKLGADNLQLGYLSSWPNLISIVAVLGVAAAVARSEQKQRLIAAIFLVGRGAALGAAAVPWFPEGLQVWALIGFWTLSVFPVSAAGSAMQSYLADVFPGNERARAFASRQSWAAGAGMVVVLTTGWLLDNLFPQPLGYQIMFAGSFLFAVLEVYFFLRLREQEGPAAVQGAPTSQERGGGWRSYLQVFRHKPYLHFLLCSVPFHFTWQMAWPLFTRFQVSELHISNTMLSMIGVANSLAAVLTYPLWARWAERRGNKVMIFQAALHLATAPFLTALVPSAPWLVVVNLFTGIGVAGIMLMVLNNLLDVSPNEGRPIYLAVHTALVSVSATIAPMVGAFMLETWPVRQGLMISAGFRVLSAVFFYIWMLRAASQKGNVTEAANIS
ncbi:MAG: MFS transporter [Bacillota bacterium]